MTFYGQYNFRFLYCWKVIYRLIVSPINSEDISTKILYARFKKKREPTNLQINSNSGIL